MVTKSSGVTTIYTHTKEAETKQMHTQSDTIKRGIYLASTRFDKRQLKGAQIDDSLNPESSIGGVLSITGKVLP